ncbi:hypothetical protein CBM2605_B130393 [Cupriavidus neocaledonicus]|uniref:Uncharacterized protein n=1 Tax=Cupriavidus neocaledonicus TaxID=1040979 RepID=A0ABY1V8R6_9BURK|nr:hypothetical protein CBM2605_B130393 [Cupriavidus neocaledonicus]
MLPIATAHACPGDPVQCATFEDDLARTG